MIPSKTVRIVTLGCAKNEVDSEEIAGVLRDAGYELVTDTPYADITIVNTCGFLDAAKMESIDAVKKAVRTKGRGKVIVAGCLTQRMGGDLIRLTPGADGYVGVGQMGRFDQLVNLVQQADSPVVDIEPPHHKWANVQTRARDGHPWSAYLKISEGCDHQCTFCTIPSFRGKHVSKPIERVIEEAIHLVKSGAKELCLIAQDVTQYGYDLYREFTLPKLLRELNQVEGVEWVRLLYFYPNRLTDEVIEAIATLEHVVKYVDIPLQHTHPDTLRRMKRPWDGDRYLALFEKLRGAIPDVAIRTTFIVGFPGETESEFNHMVGWVKEARLDRVGAFEFSREPGTPSYDMENQVPTKVKKARFDTLMKAQQSISYEMNQQWVGKNLNVLIESSNQGWSSGRSFRDAPEIDGLVYVEGTFEPGMFADAKITNVSEYDLYAETSQVQNNRKPLKSLRMATPGAPK